jgi:alginate O-acetyltransferase complex protein AlgI
LIAFTLQIYFDFAGYTDMAIGLGMMFGFHLPENFNYPYISRSITEFWRRWHMSLTAWMRQYVFLPLEYSRRRDRFFRQQTNILIVFILTGLWHGPTMNFLFWGLYFGLILAIEVSGFGKILEKAPRFLQHFYTLALIMAGWIFFRESNIYSWGSFISALFGGNGLNSLVTLRTLNILMYLPLLVIASILCTPIVRILEERIKSIGVKSTFILDIIYLGFFFTVVSEILSNGFASFLYVQF